MITKPAEFEALGIKAELHRVIEPKQGRGAIYISNYFSAMNMQLLQEHSVQAVLTIAKGCFLTYTKEQIPNYLYIPIDDKSSVDITQHFDRCFSFIEKSRTRTNVLIHCKVGLSRSVTILIAYLMGKLHFSLKQAYEKVRAANPRIKPNCGFMKQLEEYQVKIYGKQQFVENRARSMRNSPAKDESLEESKLNARQMSLCKKARELQGVSDVLQTKITRIKNLIEHQNCRKRSNSEYLRRKMSQMKQKKLIQAEGHKESLQSMVNKRVQRLN